MLVVEYYVVLIVEKRFAWPVRFRYFVTRLKKSPVVDPNHVLGLVAIDKSVRVVVILSRVTNPVPFGVSVQSTAIVSNETLREL